MSIYGSNSSPLLAEPVTATPCLDKLDEAECHHCCQVTQRSPLLPPLPEPFSSLKLPAQSAVWYHTGLLVLIMILGFLLAGGVNSKEDLTYVDSPHTGDIYHVRTQEGNYSLLKVVAVDGNSVQLQANTYQTSSSSEVADLNKPENYDRESFDLTRYDLQIMMRKEQIVDVERAD
jgi:hypothetical protein